MEKNETLSVGLMVLLLAFAVVIVDDRWVRAVIALLPALMLAQRALAHARAPAEPEEEEDPADRREDHEVRGYVDELLKHFREFYTTCHLMGTGVLTPQAAEQRATSLERELNRLLATITRVTRAKHEPGARASGSGGDDVADATSNPEKPGG